MWTSSFVSRDNTTSLERYLQRVHHFTHLAQEHGRQEPRIEYQGPGGKEILRHGLRRLGRQECIHRFSVPTTRAKLAYRFLLEVDTVDLTPLDATEMIE